MRSNTDDNMKHAHTNLKRDQQAPTPELPMRFSRTAPALLLAFSLSGCAVVAVADAAVSVVATGVKVTAKAAGAVVDAVIPDSE
ncbi:MAG: NF038104 family lipoprotein [Quisquiliibacterium sp.]